MVSTQKMSFLASFFVIGLLSHVVVVVAVDVHVGGGFGWNIPPTPTFFSEWANSTTFFVGDMLVFNLSANNETHNFAMAGSQAELDGCVKPGLVFHKVISVGFNEPARKYFMCTIGNHCNLGMKFAIDVLPKPGSIPPNAAVKIAAFPTQLLLYITIITNFLFFISD